MKKIKLVRDSAYPVYFPTTGKYFDVEVELPAMTVEWIEDAIVTYQSAQKILAEAYINDFLED